MKQSGGRGGISAALTSGVITLLRNSLIFFISTKKEAWEEVSCDCSSTWPLITTLYAAVCLCVCVL